MCTQGGEADGDIVVNNMLRLDAGSFDDEGITLSAKGNVNMDVVHTHGGSGNGGTV